MNDELIEDLAVRRHLPCSCSGATIHEGQHIDCSDKEGIISTDGAINSALLYPTDVLISG